MDFDDIIYLALLFLTIFLGRVFRSFQTKNEKQVFATFVGICIIVLVSGFHALHMFLTTLCTLGLIKFCPRSCIHVVGFFGLFFHLFFFRICHYLYFPMPPALTNGIQMLLTLKLIGMCFEVHDTWRKKERIKYSKSEEEKDQLLLELKYEEVNPSDLDVIHYAFCYVGVLTGPYYKFRTYSDMVCCSHRTSNVDYERDSLHRFRHVPFYAIMYILSNYLFPLSFAETDTIFRDYSFLYRVLYMTPVFFTFRMRIYSGFVLSEIACMMAGLGAYPTVGKNRPGRGPSDFKALEEKGSKATSPDDYDFETIHNIDEWGSDFSTTVREGMRCWNMTIQFWLATNVYKRMKTSKAVKEATTMLVSAFWHGVHSGYYLSMLTVPFILAVEDFYNRLIRPQLSETGRKVYDFITWFVKMQQFAYMGMAFLLLRADATIYYWRSIGFIYHGLIVLMHAVATYFNLIRAKANKKLEKSRITSADGGCKVKFSRHAEDAVGAKKLIGEGDVLDISDVLGVSDDVTKRKKE